MSFLDGVRYVGVVVDGYTNFEIPIDQLPSTTIPSNSIHTGEDKDCPRHTEESTVNPSSVDLQDTRSDDLQEPGQGTAEGTRDDRACKLHVPAKDLSGMEGSCGAEGLEGSGSSEGFLHIQQLMPDAKTAPRRSLRILEKSTFQNPQNLSASQDTRSTSIVPLKKRRSIRLLEMGQSKRRAVDPVSALEGRPDPGDMTTTIASRVLDNEAISEKRLVVKSGQTCLATCHFLDHGLFRWKCVMCGFFSWSKEQKKSGPYSRYALPPTTSTKRIFCRRCKLSVCGDCGDDVVAVMEDSGLEDDWSKQIRRFIGSQGECIILEPEISHCCEWKMKLGPASTFRRLPLTSTSRPQEHSTMMTSDGCDGALVFPEYDTVVFPSFRGPDALALSEQFRTKTKGPWHCVLRPSSFGDSGPLRDLEFVGNDSYTHPYLDLTVPVETVGKVWRLKTRFIFVARKRELEDKWVKGTYYEDAATLRGFHGLLSRRHCERLKNTFKVDLVVLLGGEAS